MTHAFGWVGRGAEITHTGDTEAPDHLPFHRRKNPMSTSTKSDKSFARLPLKPLWDIARIKSDMPEVAAQTSASLGFTSAMFADMIGHHPKAVNRWQETDTIPWLSADAAAVALGTLPHLVWGDDWLNVKGDYDEIASGARDAELDRAWKAAAADLAVELEGIVSDELLASVVAMMTAERIEDAEADGQRIPELDELPEPWELGDDDWEALVARWDAEDAEAEVWALHVAARDEVFLNS